METPLMSRTILTPSILIIPLLLAPVSNVLSANQEIITEDGREALLNEDGTWSFRSTDRFANTKDGRRVRLKDDGSWQHTGNAPVILKEQVRTMDLDIKLQKVVIETHEKKVQKNKRIKTQTVFYLDLELSALAKENISINKNDMPMIKVRDNKGKDYPVLSIQPSPTTVKPGSNTTIVIRAKSSPSWLDNIKSMEVVLNPGVFGIQDPITFNQNVTEFDNKKVDGFENN
jgi:hypothetical protein